MPLTVELGATVWCVDGRCCPSCGMPVYTDGRQSWCAAYGAAWGACIWWEDAPISPAAARRDTGSGPA